jgi:ribonuclease HI
MMTKVKKMHWYSWWKMCFPKKEGGMGFRDLHSFNLAMLSKQVWRLLDEPNSLCAKVLRAKYYPDGDVLKAGPKAGSSFTWQSIVAGIQAFKRGCIWRVGNGDKIDIWRDCWIPSSPNRKILTPRGDCVLSRVEQLIDPILEVWDRDLIESIFNPLDASRILQIPLHTRGFDDFISWHGTKNGMFSVRSAYHIEWRHQFNGVTCRSLISGTSPENPTWKILWNLAVPAKVKIFCWRIMHGVIPLKAILFSRHIGNSANCPLCDQHPEDILHMVFKCNRSVLIWEALGITDVLDRAISASNSGPQALEKILKLAMTTVPGLDELKIPEIVAIGSWYIWWLRRRQTHGEQIPPIQHCVNSIRAITANARKSVPQVNSVAKKVWARPLARNLKVNVDAAYLDADHTGAIGAIVRDNQGNCVAATSKFLSHVSSAMMAEALAVLYGLEMVNRLGFNSIEIESDSMEVIQFCTGEERIWNDATAVYVGIFEHAASIGHVEFHHCRRETNMVAHEIARNSLSTRTSCNWVDEPPSFILSALLNDVTIL